MNTLEVWLNQTYSTKKVNSKVIQIEINDIKNYQCPDVEEFSEKGELDLSEFENLKRINISRFYFLHSSFFKIQLKQINLGCCPNLTSLDCSYNNLTSVDFLKNLSYPERLKALSLVNNDIESTNVSMFSKFNNLEVLMIGILPLNQNDFLLGKRNRFYGSLKFLKNLTKLKILNFEATDISEGIEYLPMNIGKKFQVSMNLQLRDACLGIPYLSYPDNKEDRIKRLYVSYGTKQFPNVKCQVIYEELKNHDFDLKAWGLANPEKVLLAQPELFVGEQQEEWLTAIKIWIATTKNKIIQDDSIIRDLEQEVKELEEELLIEREEISKFHDKSVQYQIKRENVINELEKENKELKEKLKKFQCQIEMLSFPHIVN